jgi:hypothetical protein
LKLWELRVGVLGGFGVVVSGSMEGWEHESLGVREVTRAEV